MWAKFDDQFYLNPKNAAMDRDEQDIYIASLVYANGQLTDGFIPGRVLAMLAVWAKLPIEANAQAIASRLVEHCFWEITSNGWMIHDFLDWNMSKAEALALKENRTEAGRRGGLASVAKRQASARANAKQVLKQNATQTQTQSLSSSHTQSPADVAENPTAYNLILDLTQWIAIPPSPENTEFLRDVPTIIQRKGKDSKIYLQGFWNTYNERYPGSTRLAWIGWALTGEIPPNRPEQKNGRNGNSQPTEITGWSAA